MLTYSRPRRALILPCVVGTHVAKVVFRQCCMLAYSSSSLLSFYCTVAAYVTCCFPAVLSRAAFGQALQLSRSVQMMLSYIVGLGSDQASITAFRRCYLAFLSLGQAFQNRVQAHALSLLSARIKLSALLSGDAILTLCRSGQSSTTPVTHIACRIQAVSLALKGPLLSP